MFILSFNRICVVAVKIEETTKSDMAEPIGKEIGNGYESRSSANLREKRPGSLRKDTSSDAGGTDVEKGGIPHLVPLAKETTQSEFT